MRSVEDSVQVARTSDERDDPRALDSRQRRVVATTRRSCWACVLLLLATRPYASTALQVGRGFVGRTPVVASTRTTTRGGSGTIIPSSSSSSRDVLRTRTSSSTSSSSFLSRDSSFSERRDSLSTRLELFDDGKGDATSTSMSSVDEDAMYKTAIERTLVSVVFSSLCGFGMFYAMGTTSGIEFFTAYLVELSLSVDNLFVFLLLFDFFDVPTRYQNRVLNYGILGSVVMRAVMIGLGSAVLERFRAVLLVFAGILIYSSVVALFPASDDDEEEDMSENAVVRFSQSLFPTTDLYDGENFFTLVDGVKMATPLLICLVAVELSDIVFAVDSIPAVFGVTEDPFIVFTSNMCAILGLRSLYSILSKAAADLKYLETSVALVLGFIGSKLVAEYAGYNIPMTLSLVIVLSVLGGGVGLSLLVADNEDSVKVDA